jgi:hypothetical protein
MRDQIARKRLKKRMLDRWENEGGRIANDTTGEDATTPTGGKSDRNKEPGPPRDNPTGSAPRARTKKAPTRK